MFQFMYIESLWLLVLLIPLAYMLFYQSDTDLSKIFAKPVLNKIQLKNNTNSRLIRSVFLMLSIVCIIFSLARPQLVQGEIKIKTNYIHVIVGIDMSKSMFSTDVYPNRFTFAQQKFKDILNNFTNAKVGLLGFSSQSFLISPLTEDFNSLTFLVKNLTVENMNLKGTNILSLLASANEMFEHNQNKIVLLFSDGGDQTDFSAEISYAKDHNITVYVYNIGTEKGGVIPAKNGVLKDNQGNIVVVKRTDNIKALALATKGGYLENSLSNDSKILANSIQKKFKAVLSEDTVIKDKVEVFYYPLSLGILFLLLGWHLSLNINLSTRKAKT